MVLRVRVRHAAGCVLLALCLGTLPLSSSTHAVEQPAPGAQDAPAATRTIWDGVFTQAQAERGRDVYRKSCSACHKADLLGESAAPALAGAEFVQRWVGSNVDDLLTTIRRSMPQDAPDSLGTAAYVDLVSYLLSVNGSPAGTTDMPLESAGLKQIQFTAR